MYESYFNLSAEPFRLSPDHRFCFRHDHYSKARSYMAYAFRRAEGFVLVTGEPGTGKTTLVGDLVESLSGENVVVAKLVSTQLAADDLLRMVGFAFGLGTGLAEKSSVLQLLNARLLHWRKAGTRALLIVDEAQDLSPPAMEELRLLTNLQQGGSPLLQIFLLGQPELRAMVQGRGMEQVHQRIIATSHLEPLSPEETRAYVEHRLRVVGWRNDPAISTPVFAIIHRFSDGVPRRINLICSRLLLHACVEQRHEITVADARIVVSELQHEQLSRRDLLREAIFLAEDSFDTPSMDPGIAPPDGPEAETTLETGGEDESVPPPQPGPDVGPGQEERSDPEELLRPEEIAGPPPFTASTGRTDPLPGSGAVPEPAAPALAGLDDLPFRLGEAGKPVPRLAGMPGLQAMLTALAVILAGLAAALIAGIERFL